MLLSQLDFDLPEELIAQQPLEDRSASRMLVVDRKARSLTDSSFRNLAQFLRRGDLLVINNTQVFPARLYGQTDTGANVELFLVRQIESDLWEALARPARRLSTGKTIRFAATLSGTVIERMENGRVHVQLSADGNLEQVIDAVGRTPLPPYIKRSRDSSDTDRHRYQTMFAKERGSIAAPTAGLHFTPSTLESLQEKGVDMTEVTLHVGYGTFEPVRVAHLSEHHVTGEFYSLAENTAQILNAAKEEGRRIVAVGTTTTRVLETTLQSGMFRPGRGMTELTIKPDHEFKAVDALITNFHLPKSSLLLLTSVFGGHELIMGAYNHAVAERYRFYSYGDCMLIT
jgi:S-adenosylmethionine:tRNA ribosyltransferase-isomerase